MRTIGTRGLLCSGILIALGALATHLSRSSAQENALTKTDPTRALRVSAQKLADEVVPRLEEARQSQRRVEELRLEKFQLENAYRAAMMTVEVARIAETEYIEGTYPQDVQTALGEIELAKSELERAKDRLEFAKGMMAKGGISQAAFLDEKYALQKAEFNLRQAITKKLSQNHRLPGSVREV